VKIFALSAVVALGTLTAMAVAGSVFFASGAIIFPSIVAWVAASVFAFERRPRHLWLHVAAIGVLVAGLLSLYFLMVPRLFPPPPGYMQGGPNAWPPPGSGPSAPLP
jgi:hypothetical protein